MPVPMWRFPQPTSTRCHRHAMGHGGRFAARRVGPGRDLSGDADADLTDQLALVIVDRLVPVRAQRFMLGGIDPAHVGK